MILGGLFESLLREGMWLVTTSNLAPHELYRDGLQRSRFLPAIELLERRLEVLAVDGGIDYRLRTLQRHPIYLDSAAPDTPARLQSLFEQLSGEHADSDTEMHLQGRRLRARRRRGDVVWFTFATLCEGPRSQTDYAELAQEFHTVVLSEVPRFTRAQQDNAARRFIALIDVLYDQAVKLIVSAAAPAQQLYQGERLRLNSAAPRAAWWRCRMRRISRVRTALEICLTAKITPHAFRAGRHARTARAARRRDRGGRAPLGRASGSDAGE